MSDPIESIAAAVLYEGYALYPYRASSVKNRIRFPFGTIYPPGTDGERSVLRAQLLVRGGAGTRLSVKARFLALEREPDGWCSAAERAFSLTTTLGEVAAQATFEDGRRRGTMTLGTELVDGANRVTVSVHNESRAEGADRESALTSAFASAHVIVRIEGGAIVSLADPPETLRAAASACENDGWWPVLVGAPGSSDAALVSPVVLEDHPRIAPESATDLFDGTEIDEILVLRIATMTDDEKAEARRTDPRIATLLDRVEALGPSGLAALHGALRETPAIRSHAGIACGARVRLRPRARADAFDLALDGRIGRVTSIERDFEGRALFAVVVEDDPGADLGEQGFPGHRFFFGPEEVEPC